MAAEPVREPKPISRGADPALAELTDDALVERVRDDDRVAFETLMRRYNARLFRLARAMLRDEADAEDVVQESYVRAFERLGQYRGPGRFVDWLTRIAANEALARLRRAQRIAPEQGDGPVAQVLPLFGEHAPSPEQDLADAQLRAVLERSIDELPEDFRVAFVLREVERLSVAETAACLGIDPQTVKTRVHRAKRLLRTTLDRRMRSGVRAAFPFAGARCDRIVLGVLARLP
jgi:RNA polymerase sigma-70 factor, ECF subfamily